ncbi:MAG: ABC transporter ATP-binding protein [Trueperaceae bacterium]|nr:ABC transporter ATP-binding protein [Trueperaceae bacterium]
MDTASTSPVVALEGLTKRYRSPGHLAVDDLSLDVRDGEILCLLGPSGCGKTTLLRLIAGFETPDAGRVVVAGREVAGPAAWVPPDRRRIGFVFQDYALFPHLNVLHNVAFGLRDGNRAEREARAAEVLDLVGLTIFAGRFPHQLSGGQQQRVALARALAPAPAVLLLDEPFSNLDAALRGSTRDEVRAILKRTGTTAVLVTHDQEEALTFADRLAVMRSGHLEQVGEPEAIYLRPRTAFVASFLGRTNLLRGEAHGARARTGLGDVLLARAARGQVMLSVRPEALAFDPGGDGVPVRVLQRDFKGHDLTFTCQSTLDPTLRLVVQTGPECAVREGDVVPLALGGAAVPLEGSGKRAAVDA